MLFAQLLMGGCFEHTGFVHMITRSGLTIPNTKRQSNDWISLQFLVSLASVAKVYLDPHFSVLTLD